MKKTGNIRKSIFLLVLISAVLFTMLVFTTTLAHYTSAVTASGSVQVAKFNVTAKGASGEKIALNSETPSYTYSFTVTSTSEVAVQYDIVVTLDRVPAEGVALVLDNGTVVPTLDGNTYTFANVGTFGLEGERTNSHELTVTVPTDNELFYDVSVFAEAHQIQPKE